MNNVSRRVWWASWMSLPFWSVPWIPGTYAALTPFIGAAASVVLLRARSRWSNGEIAILAGLPVVGTLGTLAVEGGGPSQVHLTIGILGWALALGSYVGFREATREQRTVHELLAAPTLVARACYALAAVESLLVLTKVKPQFDFIFSLWARRVGDRLTLTTSEPSWAVQVLLLFLPVILYAWHRERRRSDLVLIVLLPLMLLSSFSVTSVVVALLALGLTWLLVANRRMASRMLGGLVAVLVFAIVTAWAARQVYPDAYFTTRLQKLPTAMESGESLESLLLVDESLLVRLGYPLIALNAARSAPVGIGVGQFGVVFRELAYDLPSLGSADGEVVRHIDESNADPRNFYLRVALDHGWAGFGLLGLFWATIIQRVRGIEESELRFMLGAMCAVVLVLGLQFSTPYFSPYWLIASLAFACAERTSNASTMLIRS